MSIKSLKQYSLADAMLAHHKALEELDHVNNILDWSRIECHLNHIHNKTKGEQGWPPIMMF